MAYSSKQVPYTGPYSFEGNGKHKGNTATALKRAMSRLGHFPWEPDKWDDQFNRKLESALDAWDPGKNGYAEGRWEKIRKARIPAGLPNSGQPALDATATKMIRNEAGDELLWRDIGPVYNGGASVLQHDCTHPTTGIPLYPAFDDAFLEGTSIIAPEPLAVTRSGTSNPGKAFYADGESGLRYWIAHLDRTHVPGKDFDKGDFVGKVCQNNISWPHTHIAINVERLWGSGAQFAHKIGYVHGAPLIGDQLAAGGPL